MEKKHSFKRREFLKGATAGALGTSIAGFSPLKSETGISDTAGKRMVERGARGMVTYQKIGEPLQIRGKRMAFTNYHYIRPAAFAWYDDQGNRIGVHDAAGPYNGRLRPIEAPLGIRIVAQPAERSSEPYLVEPQKPWEADSVSLADLKIGWGSLMYDDEDGYYKAWGTCSADGKDYQCYLQSTDFENWERPELGLVEFQGNKKNNLIETDDFGFVFKDPSSREERWKWIAVKHGLTRREYEAFQKKRPGHWDPIADRADVSVQTHAGPGNMINYVRGGVSRDGFRWKTIGEPLLIHHADTLNTCYYDSKLAKYVAYTRSWVLGEYAPNAPYHDRGLSWMNGRRSVGRAETDDFRTFPLPEVIMTPGPDTVGPSDTFYNNTHTFVPLDPDQHLFFPTVWHQLNDSTSVAVASSSDGKIVHWLPGNPVITTATFGAWDGGCIFVIPHLMELPDGRWILPYIGFNVPHKYPRKRAENGLGFASWKKGRLVAVEAPEKGQFSTFTFMPPRRKIQINALTVRGGSVRMEIADHEKKVVPGRSFEDCHPIVGDQYRATVTWKGGDDIGVPPNRPIFIRFELDHAKVFFVDFV